MPQFQENPDFIYLDHQATTPLDPMVLQAMMPFFEHQFANPSSSDHRAGHMAAQAVQSARAQVAEVIGAEPLNVIFTSGATESINTAIKGLAAQDHGRRKEIVTCRTEHSAVLGCCDFLSQQGYHIKYLEVNRLGHLDLDEVARTLSPETLMLSLMFANNETGVVHDIAAIGAIAKKKGVFFHCDAAQAVGKCPLNVMAMNIDLLSLSAHKFYGPKGIGALYIRRKHPRVRLTPLIHGGGHERGYRSGTANVPAIVGMGEAIAMAAAGMGQETERLIKLRNLFLTIFEAHRLEFEVNGDMKHRLAGNLNLRFPGIPSEALLEALPMLALSRGSACTSAVPKPSHVLLAMGLSAQAAGESFRLSIGRTNTEKQIRHAAEAICKAASQLKANPPEEKEGLSCGW